MASKNVVRTDVVQIRYDVDDSPLQDISREVNEMRDNVVSGTRASDNALDGLQRETRQTGDEFREAGQDTREFNQDLRNTSDEARSTSGILGKLKSAIGGLGIGTAVGGALGLGAIVGVGNDGVKAMNQLQAQTGATAQEMQELGSMAKEVYADNLGESLDDVAKSMANVKNITGTSGKELQGLTHNALLLRDTFDFDVNENVRTADMLMKQFGISGDEAYNLIAQGAQLGLDKNGNLLDSINEYSVHFKQLGLDSKDMMSMFANSAEQGVFDIDKIGDAVKEFGIRAIDGSKTTQEGFAAIGLSADDMAAKFTAGGDTAKSAFQETINALAGMKDPVEQNAAGVALFGTMWEDLGPKAVLAMSTANDKVNEGTDALEGINAVKYNDATSALSALGRTINVELADATSGAVGIAVEAIRGFTAGMKEAIAFTKENWSTIKPILMAVAIILGGYVGILAAYTAGTKLAAAAELLKAGALKKSTLAMLKANAAMLMNPWTWVVIGIVALVAGIVMLVKHWDTVKAAVMSFVSAAIGYLGQFWSWVVSIFNSVKAFTMSIFSGIASFLSGIWQSIWGVIGGAVTAIWSVISTTFSYIFQIIGAIMQGIWGIITSIWSSIVSVVGGFLRGYYNLVMSIWSTVFSFIGGIMSSIAGVISRIWSGIVSKVGGFLGNIWTEVTSKFNELVSWLGNLKDKFLEVGGNLIKGLLDGITNKMGDLKAKVQEIGDNVLGGVKDFFGIASPSKEFALVGKYNVEGLEQGIESSLPSLRQTVRAVGENTLEGYSSGYTPESSAVLSRSNTNETNHYNPQFNLTINGAEDTRGMERKVKQWIREAMQDTFDGFGRRNPRLREV